MDEPGDGAAETGRVCVWLIRLDPPPATVDDLATTLDPVERGRVSAFARDSHRRRYIVAHGAARSIAGRFLDRPARLVRWRLGSNGKPGVGEGWHVNLAHSGELAAFAVTRDAPVGVDVQRLAAGLDPLGLAVRYFPPAEAAYVGDAGDPTGQLGRFAELWSRKEACVKASGARLVQGMMLPVCRTDRPVRDPGGALPGPYLVRDVAVGAGYHAAVAVAGDRPYRVALRWW